MLWNLKQLIAPFLFDSLALSALRYKNSPEKDVGIEEFLLKGVITVVMTKESGGILADWTEEDLFHQGRVRAFEGKEPTVLTEIKPNQ